MLFVMKTLESERPQDYLTRLAESELGRAYKALVLREMQVEPGCTVLDLGCGPGTDLVAFADAAGSQGRIIGIDHDTDAIAEATELVSSIAGAEVSVGDVHRLSLAERSVDRIHTDRVLQHVERPSTVLSEAARVLRPGGIAAFAEPDWDTLVIDFPDPEVSAAYRRFVVDRVVRNARIGRGLPRLCEQQGLLATRVVPVTAIYRDVVDADRVLGLQRVTSRAVDAGYLTEVEGAEWLRHLRTARFFASISLFVTVAERPTP